MKSRVPRCIAITDATHRCKRPAAKQMGDLYCCTRHDFWHVAIIDDWLCATTRRALAFARWTTAREGQALINRMHARAA